MKATEHSEYTVEASYLTRVLQVIQERIVTLDNLGWSGGGNPRATIVLGESFSRRADVMRGTLREPYFGRIDRTDNGLEANSYYIGQAGIADSAAHDRLVVDWRAEIARHFYRPDSHTLLKRRFVIRDRTLQEIHDDHLARTATATGRRTQAREIQILADPALKSLLESSHGQQLASIAATIQAEQDELIRASDQTLIIQGGAGTGKTIVALHRLAYLLYHHRNDTAQKRELRVAVFGPHRLFLHFISSVLPSLGEHGILQTTFEDWFSAWCGRDATNFPSWDEELERMLDPLLPRKNRAENYRRARFKSSLRMGKVLRRFVEQLRDRALDNLRNGPLRISVARGSRRPVELVLPAELLVSVAQSRGSLPLNRAQQAARETYWQWIRSKLEPIVEAGPDRAALFGEARRKFEAALEKRWPHHRFATVYRTLLSDSRLFRSLSADLGEKERRWLQPGDKFGLEDVAPLAYLRLILDGPAVRRDAEGQETGIPQRFDHIVVDEAQDFAPLQLVVLRAHTDGLTLMGDVAQGIHSYRGLRSWDEACEALDGTPARVEALSRGYRSTRQITELANQLLRSIDGASAIQAFPRDGEPPRLMGAHDERDAMTKVTSYVNEILDRPARTVAIIAKSASHARATYLYLRDRIPAESMLVTTRDDTRSSTVTVLPAYLAKGMEFDAVVVVDADAFHYRELEYDAKLLYIAMTRALHSLFVVWTGTPSPLLPHQSAMA